MCWNALLEQFYHQEAPDINTSIQPVHANGRQQSSLLMNAMVVCDNKGPTHTALHAEFLSVICFCSSLPAALLRFTPHTDRCSGPADILKYMIGGQPPRHHALNPLLLPCSQATNHSLPHSTTCKYGRCLPESIFWFF